MPDDRNPRHLDTNNYRTERVERFNGIKRSWLTRLKWWLAGLFQRG